MTLCISMCVVYLFFTWCSFRLNSLFFCWQTVGIHFTLQHFSNMRYAPNSADANLCKRAHNILKKWHPMFLAHLSKRRWAFKGPLCMGYVPMNDGQFFCSRGHFIDNTIDDLYLDFAAIRTSPDALDIIYGLKDEMTLQAIFWPTFMSYA